MVDDAHLLDHLLHLAQKVARDQHRCPGSGGHILDERPHFLDARGVQAVRWLVQDQQLWAAQQCHGDTEPLFHTQRILPHLAAAVLRQVDDIQHAANVFVGHAL